MTLGWLQWIVIIFLLLLPVLYELNKTFKYYVKYTLFVAVNMLICAVVAIYLLPRVIMGERHPKNYKYLIYWVKIEKRLFGLCMDIRGHEHVEANKPCIIVCNHQSSIDLFGTMEIWPESCSVMVKKSLLYSGPLGLVMWMVGTVFVNRTNRKEAASILSETSEHIKKEKISIIIFPEGTRNPAPEMLPFKKGAFNLAVLSQIPIVPVVMSSYSEFYSKKEKIFNPGKFIITCLPPISTEGKKLEDVAELAESVRSQMMEVFKKTCLEATQANSVTN